MCVHNNSKKAVSRAGRKQQVNIRTWYGIINRVYRCSKRREPEHVDTLLLDRTGSIYSNRITRYLNESSGTGTEFVQNHAGVFGG